MLDYCTNKGMGLNEIAMMPFDNEDYVQLMQLIGYSVSGYGDLSRIPKKEVDKADEMVDQLRLQYPTDPNLNRSETNDKNNAKEEIKPCYWCHKWDWCPMCKEKYGITQT